MDEAFATTDVVAFSDEVTITGLLTSSQTSDTVHSTTQSYEDIQTFYTTTGSNSSWPSNITQNVNYFIPLAERILESIILSIIWILAFWGNLLLWLVVFRRQSLQTVTNAMVLCLSFADLLVSIVNLPITIYTLAIGATEWEFGNTMCVILGFMNMLTFVASVMSLAAIGICRYLFIVHPEKFRRVYTKRNTAWIIAGVWIFSGLLASPPLLGWGIYDYLPGQSFCFCDWTTSVSYTFFMVGVCFGGPCSVMTFCYVQILRVVRRSRKRVDSFTKRQSTMSIGKVDIPPVVKVHPTDNDFKGNRTSCSSFTISVASNSGVSSSESVVGATLRTSADQGQINTNSNCLQVPRTKSKRNSRSSDLALDQTSSTDGDLMAKTNVQQQQEIVLPETTPRIVTDGLSSTSDVSDCNDKTRISNGTNKNTTESILRQSVSIEEDRPSFLARLSHQGSTMKLMVSSRSERKKITANERSKRRRQEELKLTKSFVVVIFCFIICWMPFCIAMFWSVFGKHPPPRIFDMGTLILGYFNSCCNPIIYGVMNNKFRAGYKAILCRSCGRNKGAFSLNSSIVGGEGSIITNGANLLNN